MGCIINNFWFLKASYNHVFQTFNLEMKCSFFQAAIVSILLCGCTIWTLAKRLEKKLDDNYRRMLRAILNRSWRQHPTKQQLYGHLLPITKTIQVKRTRHAGHSWRSRNELISDVLLWTPSHGRAKAGRPARTYIQQLNEDTRCIPEHLPDAMYDRERWRERVKDIRTDDENFNILNTTRNYLVKEFLYTYLPNPSARAGYDTRSIVLSGV